LKRSPRLRDTKVTTEENKPVITESKSVETENKTIESESKLVENPTVGNPKVVVCIPAYRMEDTIAKIVVGSMRFADQIIVCDDGSDDLTYFIAEALGVIVVKQETSLGYGSTLRNLFKNAKKSKADFVVTLDGDGQYDPADMPNLLDRLIVGDVDVVLGSRFLDGGGSAGSDPSTNLKLTDIRSGYRAFTIKALDTLHLTDEEVTYSPELLANARAIGLKVVEVPIHSEKEAPAIIAPKVEPPSGILNSLKGVFTKHPLLVFGAPGLLAVVAGLVFLAYTILTFFSKNYLSEIASTLGIVSLSVGVVLVVTSIILWVMISPVRTVKS
jgi:glycosyltransferase involved in cell wall biosynthesis